MRAHIPRVRSEAAASQRSSRAYPPNPLLVPPYTTTAAPGAASPRLSPRRTNHGLRVSVVRSEKA